MDFIKNLFTTKGRMGRLQFFSAGVFLNLCIYFAIYFNNYINPEIGLILATVIGIAVVIASICVSIQRLHDLDKPGIWVFGYVIPFFPLYLLFVTGTTGPNEYGPDPIIPKISKN